MTNNSRIDDTPEEASDAQRSWVSLARRVRLDLEKRAERMQYMNEEALASYAEALAISMELAQDAEIYDLAITNAEKRLYMD